MNAISRGLKIKHTAITYLAAAVECLGDLSVLVVEGSSCVSIWCSGWSVWVESLAAVWVGRISENIAGVQWVGNVGFWSHVRANESEDADGEDREGEVSEVSVPVGVEVYGITAERSERSNVSTRTDPKNEVPDHHGEMEDIEEEVENSEEVSHDGTGVLTDERGEEVEEPEEVAVEHDLDPSAAVVVAHGVVVVQVHCADEKNAAQEDLRDVHRPQVLPVLDVRWLEESVPHPCLISILRS